MPYTAAVNRDSPTGLLFIVDWSHLARCKETNDAVDSFFGNLVQDPEIHGISFHVGAIGYGEKNDLDFTRIGATGLLGPLNQSNRPATGESKHIASLADALEQAHDVVAEFLARFPHCFPPVVVHLTNGASTNGEVVAKARLVKSLASRDGNVLLFNVRFSVGPSAMVAFPNDGAACRDDFARLLFSISSELPQPIQTAIATSGVPISAGSRGFIDAANDASLVRFLELVTRAVASKSNTPAPPVAIAAPIQDVAITPVAVAIESPKPVEEIMDAVLIDDAPPVPEVKDWRTAPPPPIVDAKSAEVTMDAVMMDDAPPVPEVKDWRTAPPPPVRQSPIEVVLVKKGKEDRYDDNEEPEPAFVPKRYGRPPAHKPLWRSILFFLILYPVPVALFIYFAFQYKGKNMLAMVICLSGALFSAIFGLLHLVIHGKAKGSR